MNCRIYVEKKAGFDLEAKRLKEQLQESLGLKGLKEVRIFNCYDVFGIRAGEMEKAKKGIFSEAVTDNISENIPFSEYRHFAVEYLPGQFDQRADSAMQCLRLISEKNENVTVTSGKVIVLQGTVTDKELEKVKKFYINPVEMREKDLEKSLEIEEGSEAQPVPTMTDLINYSKEALEDLRTRLGLAMTLDDLIYVQGYFKDEEKRDPTETEIKVLDTYWSDHCRHTTFETKIKKIILPKSDFGKMIRGAIDNYLNSRKNVHGNRIRKKYISLMDMATIVGKELKKIGKLEDLEISNEINACSVYIDVDIDGAIEKWLLMFKNETHNHPTEIEPFGGASTCLGGAIRDPLSGRSYVYQAIRVTGSGDPLEKLNDTMDGKLPQKKITTEAARGYSSYGNQIGLATGNVSEIYDEGYKAKRMEVGAVVGAVPADHVRREEPKPGDVVVLLGGKTGRDGCGGATGSSKEHTGESLALCGAEVQKGNAPEERKIQRLFRNKDVTLMIKKCNDFGAGGVSVAIGELAPGLDINLDVVPTKYKGLSGTELAISESQERMAVLLDASDVDKFIKAANDENLIATKVAVVTDDNRLVLRYKDTKIVDISREFLDTNGVTQETELEVTNVDIKNTKIFTDANRYGTAIEDSWYNMLDSLNVASQKGLVEMFDSTIGAATVLMPFGGKYQMTPTDVSIDKVPLMVGNTNTASAITWGYDPNISKWSPYHGAAYAVIESLAKLVSAGVDYKKARMSFQEYFQKLGSDPVKWGNPFSALLGSITAQQEMGIPAIGGKDSMSGTFNDIHVPPTLVSFAVSPVDAREVISPEFKKAENYIYLIRHKPNDDQMPNFAILKENFEYMHENIVAKKIISAMTLKFGGIAEALSKMAFGNRIGAKIKDIDGDLFKLNYGSFIVESNVELSGSNVELLGKTIDEYAIYVEDKKIDMEKAENIWLSKLAPVFPYKTSEEVKHYDFTPYENTRVFVCKNKCAVPKALIMAFPGTNCEYDTARAFIEEGAEAEISVFRNITQSYIDDSIEKMVSGINNSQILVFPGGFSVGDEPDGSGKFISTVLMNPAVSEAVNKFLRRDGLILGICNGFQALIKSGLLPYGTIGEVVETSPTLTFNKIGRHVSQMVRTKIVSNKSPWLADMEPGDEYVVPVSHGEGRFFANDNVIRQLFENGQVATQYVDMEGRPTNEFIYAPNGSSYAIEGILSSDGRIFGKMGHSERKGKDLYKNIYGNKEQNIFKNGVKYFK